MIARTPSGLRQFGATSATTAIGERGEPTSAYKHSARPASSHAIPRYLARSAAPPFLRPRRGFLFFIAFFPALDRMRSA